MRADSIAAPAENRILAGAGKKGFTLGCDEKGARTYSAFRRYPRAMRAAGSERQHGHVAVESFFARSSSGGSAPSPKNAGRRGRAGRVKARGSGDLDGAGDRCCMDCSGLTTAAAAVQPGRR